MFVYFHSASIADDLRGIIDTFIKLNSHQLNMLSQVAT